MLSLMEAEDDSALIVVVPGVYARNIGAGNESARMILSPL